MKAKSTYLIPYISPEEYEKTKPLIEAFKIFFGSTTYIYIIDYFKRDFLYVSDKIARLAGRKRTEAKVSVMKRT